MSALRGDMARAALSAEMYLSDAELHSAYEGLFQGLCGMCRRRGLDREEARDVAQETILRALVHLRRHGSQRDDLRPLVHTIARNLLVERLRRPVAEVVGLSEAEQIADVDDLPVDRVVTQERRAEVRDSLASLSSRHRRVIQLWMSGLTPQQIARELGIKRNAADALLHRAKRRLATRLDPSRVALGAFGIFWFRIRSGVRRATEWLTRFDPVGGFAQAGGVAVVSVAAVLSIGAVGTSKPQAHAPRVISMQMGSSTRTTPKVASPSRVFAARQTVSNPTPERARVIADVRSHRAGVHSADNPSGKSLGVDIWEERDPNSPGLTAPVLDQATQIACAQPVTGCSGEK